MLTSRLPGEDNGGVHPTQTHTARLTLKLRAISGTSIMFMAPTLLRIGSTGIPALMNVWMVSFRVHMDLRTTMGTVIMTLTPRQSMEMTTGAPRMPTLSVIAIHVRPIGPGRHTIDDPTKLMVTVPCPEATWPCQDSLFWDTQPSPSIDNTAKGKPARSARLCFSIMKEVSRCKKKITNYNCSMFMWCQSFTQYVNYMPYR
jgi:hypothetical protein